MRTVSIVYFSASGHTTKMAEAVAQGVQSVSDTKAGLISLSEDDIVKGRYMNENVIAQLDANDAIIFGAPTFMGGPAAQFKAFADATVGSWFNQKWRNKLAAGFTISGALSGDKLATLQYFNALAMQHGMIWVGTGELPTPPNGVNRLGSWLGAMAVAQPQESPESAPNAEDKSAAISLGKRVAELLKR